MTTLFISHSSKDKEWALQFHEALLGQGYNKLFLDSHPDDGIPAGAKWEQSLWQHLRQSGAVIVLCTGNWITSCWCVAEVMIAREHGKTVFMLARGDIRDDRQVKGTADAEPQIPDFLKDTQFIDATEVDKAYQQLWRLLAGLKKSIYPLPDQPYPGLMAFDEKDAALFFGREAEIVKVNEVLNQRLRNNAKGFILILGASGCGKSSLVRAGVLPPLKRDEDSSGRRWVIPSPFMGGEGLEGLTMSLATALKEAGQSVELAAVRGQLKPARESEDGMERYARALGQLASDLRFARGLPLGGAVLLVLDQLEEVFGTPEGSEQRTMLRLLLETSAEVGSRVAVLATMRSDYLNTFQQFEGATDRYEEVTLDPMLRSHFSEVIEGPADRFGLDLDAGLSERMVEETTYNDALPLLAFTLEKLYKKCTSQGRLTLKAYDELGGVSAAIQHAADAVLEKAGYAGLPADDPRMCDLRRAFYSLARVGEEGQFTRRIAWWSQMPSSCTNVLQRFVKDRLLISGKDENDQPILSIAHEALFRVWGRLGGWLREIRNTTQIVQLIENDFKQWKENKKAIKYLLEGTLRENVRTGQQGLKDFLGDSSEMWEFCKRSFSVYNHNLKIDYKPLAAYLEEKEWEVANNKTAELMLKAAKCETKNYLESFDTDISNDLCIIDQLWRHYSGGKFGFSVQKKIYQNLGGTAENYDEEIWTKFCDQVGWRQDGSWLYNSELTFSLDNAPKGHLPAAARLVWHNGWWCELCYRSLFGQDLIWHSQNLIWHSDDFSH